MEAYCRNIHDGSLLPGVKVQIYGKDNAFPLLPGKVKIYGEDDTFLAEVEADEHGRIIFEAPNNQRWWAVIPVPQA